MDINELIKKEAPANNEHDQAYAKALKASFESFQGLSQKDLKIQLQLARERYRKNMGRHQDTADCIVLTELIHD